MLKRYRYLPKGKSGNKNNNENQLKKSHLCKTRSMRGVRKEINYSEPCSNAPDKAQLSLGCTHLSTRSLRSLVLKWVQPKLNCALS